MKKLLLFALVLLLVLSTSYVQAQEALFTPQPTMYTLPIMQLGDWSFGYQLQSYEQFTVNVAEGAITLTPREDGTKYKKGELFLLHGEDHIEFKNAKKAYAVNLEKAGLNEADLKDCKILVKTTLKKAKKDPKEISKIQKLEYFDTKNGETKEVHYIVENEKDAHIYKMQHTCGNDEYYEYFIDDTLQAVYDRGGVAVANVEEAKKVKNNMINHPYTIYTLGLNHLQEDVLDIDTTQKLNISIENGMVLVKTESGKQDFKKQEIYLYTADLEKYAELKWNGKQKAYVFDFSKSNWDDSTKALDKIVVRTYKKHKYGLGLRTIANQFAGASGAMEFSNYTYEQFAKHTLKHVFGEKEYYDYWENDIKLARFDKDGIRMHADPPTIVNTLDKLPNFPKEAFNKKFTANMELPKSGEEGIKVTLPKEYIQVVLCYTHDSGKIYEICKLRYDAEQKLWVSPALGKKAYTYLHSSLDKYPDLSIGIVADKDLEKNTTIRYIAKFRKQDGFLNFLKIGNKNKSSQSFEGIFEFNSCLLETENNIRTHFIYKQADGSLLADFYDSFGVLYKENQPIH